jgi:hypothetical protein
VSLCVSIPMMILRLGASCCNSGLLWQVLGPGAREGGQDCDGISPSSSYQVTHPTTGGELPARSKDQCQDTRSIVSWVQTPRAAAAYLQS